MTKEQVTAEAESRKTVIAPSASPKVGTLVTGTIVKVTGAVAFIDFGARNEGYIELSEFGASADTAANVGDTITAEVISTRGGVQLSYKNALNHEKLERLKSAIESKEPKSGVVASVNKGGYDVRFEGVRGFCPASQMTLKPTNDGQQFIGKTFDFLITEFTKKGGLVVSRRQLLEAKRKEAQATLGQTIKPGDRLQGTVSQITEFGIFVTLSEGVEGLVHVSEISHDRNVTPSAVAKVGDAVEVAVVNVNPEKGRVGLSFKQLEADPWSTFSENHQAGNSLQGFVTRVQPFGAFIKISDGVEGLLHVSAIKADQRLESAEGQFEIGEEITVVIDSIDPIKRRIALLSPEVAAARKPIEVQFKTGEVLTGKVRKVERFGVLLELPDGNVGLVPNVEMGTSRGTDHFRMFPVNTEIQVKVLEIDLKNRRIRLSRKALLNHDEEQAYAEYKKQEKAPESLGSFGDLLAAHLNNQKN